MHVVKQDILLLLREESEPLHFAGLLRAFGGRQVKNELKRLVEAMVRDGELVRLRGNRYTLPGAENVGTVRGTISVHRDGYGFVAPEEGGEDIFIPAKGLGGAMHGDTVSVRGEPSRGRQGKRDGRVVAVLQRANSRVVGRFQQTGRGALFIPEELRLGGPFSIPPRATNGAVDGQQVVIEVTAWPVGGRPAEGKVIEILGWPDNPDVEVQTVIRRFDLPHTFDAATLAEAEAVPAQIGKGDLEGRVDLRKLPTVTIDGETAKDFDDAVSLRREGEAFRLWVSIADVSQYVTPGSSLDRDAYLRGTSVYFPDRCLPMLPERLSNGICSLNPHQDRLTMTAELLIDAGGSLRESRFYTSVIRSDARLTYTQVKGVIEDNDPSALGEYRELAPMLLEMKQLALALMAMRRRRGSIDFDLPEPEIVLGLTGQTEAIIKSERNLAHRLIEEFMLAANEAVARFVTSRQVPFIYRIHEPPAPEKLAAFREFLVPFGFTLEMKGDTVEPAALQALVASAEGKPEERMVNYGLLRCMKQARYSGINLKHFGLASDCYTHFTSPIRRYPDLMVHRFLKLVLTAAERPLTRQEERRQAEMAASLAEAAEHTSSRERVAMEAERDIVELKKLQFMQGKVGEEFGGFIAGVAGFGCFVELTELFVEGLVHSSTLTDDLYSFEEREHALKGRQSGRTLRIGDPVTVRVVAVNPQARRIEFALVSHAAAQRPEKQENLEYSGERYPRIPVRGKRPKLNASPAAAPAPKRGGKGKGGGKRRR
ncbi:ribonuclease R [Trichlorobacter ammonificans]|uniref:Ribonuclease R n=1 Tax=Trichlorobacter ammonificans TaxID=2916410 RepID=A0ABM9D547_9BACT|nr:ribonuclease R [Trichlorobacter ammonificans]CAH2030275.1 Ribonuclease R [Trichlorobacter ammonificans]